MLMLCTAYDYLSLTISCMESFMCCAAVSKRTANLYLMLDAACGNNIEQLSRHNMAEA